MARNGNRNLNDSSRNKQDERFRLEMSLKSIVSRLGTDHADIFILMKTCMMRGVTLETLASAFAHKRRGRFFKARCLVEDAVFMLGQIAKRIDSFLLPRIVALHLDLMRLDFTGDGDTDEAEARRLAREFEDCYDSLITEVSFMDVRERANIWPKVPVHPVDRSGGYKTFYPKKCMTVEEATQGSRAVALHNHKFEMKGFAQKVAALVSCFSRLADEVQGGVAPAPSAGRSPDWQMLSKVLQTFTTLVYYKFHDMDLFFCDDPKRTKNYADIGMDFASEETEETRAKLELGREIVRYVDAAIALARRVGSESANDFVLAKSLFEKHGGDFSRAEHSLAVKADLASFLDTLKSARERLRADVAAARLGEEPPLKVELTKKSGETIAKAVRPGRGGARRIYDEDIQEKCWHYWETGRRNPNVVQGRGVSGRKVTHADVFRHYRRELGALEPPVDTPEAFKSVLRARTNRIGRKKSH